MPNFIKTVKTIQRFKVEADNASDAEKADTTGLTPFFAPKPAVSIVPDRSAATVLANKSAPTAPPVSP